MVLDMSLEDVAAALSDLGVDSSGLRAVPIEGAPDIVLAFDIEPASWFATWQLLRDSVGELELWPLATCTWGEPLEEISRSDMQGPDGLDVTPSAIIARVPDVNVDRLLDAERARDSEHLLPGDDYLTWVLDEAGLDGVDLVQLHRELGPSPDRLAVERWLLDLEVARGIAHDHDDSYLSWYVPDAVVMLLLPTVVAWEAGAFVGGFEWGHPHTDVRAALLRRWHDRHGAELAANWGTMLQLVVGRPPTTIEEAWAVAYETNLIWPDTAGGINGIATRHHARDLVGRSDWFLHFRP